MLLTTTAGRRRYLPRTPYPKPQGFLPEQPRPIAALTGWFPEMWQNASPGLQSVISRGAGSGFQNGEDFLAGQLCL